MKHALCIVVACLASSAWAQVVIDKPVQFTGPDGSRTVEAIATPTDATALLSVGTWVSGSALWANAVLVSGTFQLTTQPASSDVQVGRIVRFIVPTATSGILLAQLDALPPTPLVRPDGLPPSAGQLAAGMVAEVMFAGDRFVLMNSGSHGCPVGTIQVNERFCIDVNPGPALVGVYDAIDRCARRGAKLCRWDEYYHACTAVGAQLQGMFDDWEWVDDTANHVHLVCQTGRTTCMSQRTANGLELPSSSRCCHQLQ